jgi:PAS domain S-box-containing protein
MTASSTPLGAENTRVESQQAPGGDIEREYWRSITKGFLLLLFAIALAGIMIYREARNSVTDAVANNLQAVATLKAAQIDHWLDEKEHGIRSDMRAEFSRPELSDLLLHWLNGGMQDAGLRADLLRDLQQIREARRYLEISLRSGLDGSLLLSSDGEVDTAAPRALAMASAKNGKSVLEDFHIEDTDGVPKMHIGFINALHIGGHSNAGIVVDVTLDASEILFPMVQQWPGWNISAAMRLIRRKGDKVIVLSGLRKISNNVLPLGFSIAEADSLHAEAIHIGTGALRGLGSENQPVFAYALPVSNTPWSVIAEIEESDAFAKLNTISALTTVIVALFLLSSGWWLLQQNRNAIARARHEAERKYLTTRINYLAKYANDCIILCDASGHITEANDRCLSIYGYTQDEFVGMNVNALRPPASQSEVATLLARIAEGDGLIYETEHLGKAGLSFPVEISASLVRIDNVPCYQAIIRDISVRKKLQLEREENMRRLNDLTSRLVNVQEEERRHLSGELHDQVGANLATMNLNLRRIGKMAANPDPRQLEEMLTETGTLLSDTISSIRDYCAELRPAILDYDGLIPALKELVQRFGRRSDIAAHFRQENMQERLPSQVESMLFRIAQEALTNCAKHSNAEKVDVGILRQDQTVVMTVSDNGDGFDPQQLGLGKVGLGLLTMRERATMAGGKLSVISTPGKGTQIRVELEIQGDRRALPNEDTDREPDSTHGSSSLLRRLA